MNKRRLGFTIVELLVVIVVIGILAGVAIIGYGTWRQGITEKQLKSDLTGASGAMESGRNFGNDYPTSIPSTFTPSDNVSMTVKSGGGSYCLEAKSTTNPDVVYSKKNGKDVTQGACGTYFSGISSPSNAAICGISYGKVYCWGTGTNGQLGNGSSANALVPVAVNTSTMTGTVASISSFNNGQTCAITGGRTYCWGVGTSGQLGNGSLVTSSVPVAVNTSTMTGTVTSVSTGSGYTCAIAGGKVYCWGTGSYGQLGNGLVNTSLVPVAVNTSTMTGTVTSISTGSGHTCAIADSKAYCWGVGTNGQLGNGSSANSSVPVAVNTSVMTGAVTSIFPGNQRTCAIASGKAYCWGAGASTNVGALGNNSSASSSVPVAVDTSIMTGTVSAISETSSQHTCAIASGKAYCWGVTAVLGNGGTSSSLTPVAVNTSVMTGTVTAITTVSQHTCAIASGKAYCWGVNSYGPTDRGALGNGSMVSSNTPTAVTDSLMTGTVTRIITSPQRSCAIADDKVYCWGDGSYGALGNGSTALSLVPAAISQIP